MPIPVLSRFLIPEGAGAGELLTSDASGVATWQVAAGGSGLITPATRTTDAAATGTQEVNVGWMTIPANTVIVGSCFRVSMGGTVTVGTTAGTLSARLRMGPTVLITDPVIAVSTIIPVVSKTNVPWWADFLVTFRATGAAGSVIGSGNLSTPITSTTSAAAGQTAAVAVNTTVAQALQATIATAAAGVTMTLKNLIIQHVL